jgi:hypothetical protein
VSPDEILARRARGESLRSIARHAGTSPGTITRQLARIVDKVRTADEFKGAQSAFIRAPRRESSIYSWSVETIRAARDSQMRGDFRMPVRLAEALRTDDALFTAYRNRLAPQSAIAARLVPCEGSRGEATARKAAASVFTPRSVLKGIQGTLANHGIAIGYNEQEPNEEGTRVDFKLTQWPLEHVRWNESREVLETRTRNGPMVDIVHGDGRWTVFRNFTVKPWTEDACLLPAALLWAAHAEGVKDWAQAARSHGLAKMIGELPAGTAIQSAANTLTPEAEAFLAMLVDVNSGENGVGIRPSGSKTDFVANGSNAWQVFAELINGREKAAARIYLGTDAILGSVGGAPGVDISALFGVAVTIIQGDFEAIEQGVRTGVLEPWAAVNEGSSRYAPSLRYDMPDTDAEKASVDAAAKDERLVNAIKARKSAGLVVDQAVVNTLAAKIGVSPAPVLAPPRDPGVTPPAAP